MYFLYFTGHPLSWSVAVKFISFSDTMALIEVKDLGWGVRSRINLVNQWVNIVKYPVFPSLCFSEFSITTERLHKECGVDVFIPNC